MADNLLSSELKLSSPPLIVPVPLRAVEKHTANDAFAVWDYLAFAHFMQNFASATQPVTYQPNADMHEVKLEKEEPRIQEVATTSKNCPICCQTFVSFKGMKQHYGKVHPTSAKVSLCNICTKHFKNKYALRFHVKQVHEKQTRVSCGECGKLLYNKYILKKHLKDRHFAI